MLTSCMQVIGEMGLVNGESTRGATVVCGTNVRAVEITKTVLQYVLKKEPGVWDDICKIALARERYNEEFMALSEDNAESTPGSFVSRTSVQSALDETQQEMESEVSNSERHDTAHVGTTASTEHVGRKASSGHLRPTAPYTAGGMNEGPGSERPSTAYSIHDVESAAWDGISSGHEVPFQVEKVIVHDDEGELGAVHVQEETVDHAVEAEALRQASSMTNSDRRVLSEKADAPSTSPLSPPRTETEDGTLRASEEIETVKAETVLSVTGLDESYSTKKESHTAERSNTTTDHMSEERRNESAAGEAEQNVVKPGVVGAKSDEIKTEDVGERPPGANVRIRGQLNDVLVRPEEIQLPQASLLPRKGARYFLFFVLFSK